MMPRYGGPPATPEGQETRPLAQARPPSNDNDEGTLLLRGDRGGEACRLSTDDRLARRREEGAMKPSCSYVPPVGARPDPAKYVATVGARLMLLGSR